MSYSDRVRGVYQQELGGIREAGLFKQERFIHSPQAADIEVEFPEGADIKKVINVCANNYLGLSSHPEVLKAAHDGLDTRGYGMSSVRFICGTQDIHQELEKVVTEFLGTEDTILFPSCMDANAGVFEALLTKDDIMISDRLVHASIVDGMRLCSAERDTYKHGDMDHLEKKLQQFQDKRLRVIINDGVYSMDGDTAKLDEIVKLAEAYDALVFVDDSHASGFIGKTGRGTHEKYGVLGKIDILTTTFGKALGGASGGCVSGRSEIVEMCRQRARPYLFSNAMAPVIIAGVLEGLRNPETKHGAARQTGRERTLLAERSHRGRALFSRRATHPSCRSCYSMRSLHRISRGISTERASTPSASSSRWWPRVRPEFERRLSAGHEKTTPRQGPGGVHQGRERSIRSWARPRSRSSRCTGCSRRSFDTIEGIS